MIVSGATGSGKSALIDFAIEKFPSKFHLICKDTTREKRDIEASGLQHNFVSKEIFLKKLKAGCYAFPTEYSGNYYGVESEVLQNTYNKYQVLFSNARGREEILAEKKYMGESFCVRAIAIHVLVPETIRKNRIIKEGDKSQYFTRLSGDAAIEFETRDNFDGIDYILLNSGKLSESGQTFLNIISFELGECITGDTLPNIKNIRNDKSLTSIINNDQEFFQKVIKDNPVEKQWQLLK